MKLTTTFKMLRKYRACQQELDATGGYGLLARTLGGIEAYGDEAEINLLTILDSNGFDDAVWSLRATLQESDVTKRLIAADFAESVLHIFESKRPGDDRPRKAIQAARDYANGMIDLQAMRDAANAAVYAGDAAYAAAGDAADAAPYAAAYAAYAAGDAADAAGVAAPYAAAAAAPYAAAYADAAYARKAKKEQLAEILRCHLEG